MVQDGIRVNGARTDRRPSSTWSTSRTTRSPGWPPSESPHRCSRCRSIRRYWTTGRPCSATSAPTPGSRSAPQLPQRRGAARARHGRTHRPALRARQPVHRAHRGCPRSTAAALRTSRNACSPGAGPGSAHPRRGRPATGREQELAACATGARANVAVWAANPLAGAPEALLGSRRNAHARRRRGLAPPTGVAP